MPSLDETNMEGDQEPNQDSPSIPEQIAAIMEQMEALRKENEELRKRANLGFASGTPSNLLSRQFDPLVPIPDEDKFARRVTSATRLSQEHPEEYENITVLPKS